MGGLIGWLLNNPDSDNIGSEAWGTFLNGAAAILLVTLIVTLVAIVVGYAFSARARKIRYPGDVFKTYSPLYWLALAVAGGVVASILTGREFSDVLGVHTGLIGIALTVFLFCTAVAGTIAYLLIVFVPALTPAKFRYRAAPFLHRGKSPAH